jgi:hypothetical protein
MEENKVDIIDGTDIATYLKNVGKRGEKTISLLAQLHPYIHELLEHEVARRHMAYDISMHEEFLLKEYNGTITDKERGQYDYLKQRINDVAKTWARFYQLQEQVKKGGDNATNR